MTEYLNGENQLNDGLKQVRKIHKESHKDIREFTNQEVEEFNLLNNKLKSYEKIMRQETESLYTYAKSRVNNSSDIVTDFEIEIKLYFYLSENDPAFIINESDNIMCILQTSKYGKLDWKWGFGDESDHNTLPNRAGTLMENEKHCATFHALYDHTILVYEDILRIGSFEMDIQLHLTYN